MTDKPPSPSQIDPQNLTIRLVQKEDLQALEWEGVYQKYRRMYARLFEDSQFGKILMWLVESPEREVIGQVFVMLNSGERDAADGYTRAYVFAFRVKPQWRNRGIGTLLMAHVEEDLLKKGFTFATLNVAKANPDARRLYERLGYKVVRSKPGIWSFRDDTGAIQHVNEPAWRMVKRLD